MTVDGVFSLGRVIFAFIYWAGLGVSSTVVLVDSMKRMKRIHLLSMAFVSLFLGGTFLIIRLLFPALWDVGLAISVMFYSLALIFFRFHFELMRKNQLPSWITAFSAAFVTILVLGVAGTITDPIISKDIALGLSFTTLLFLAFISLPLPFLLSIKEYLMYKNRQQFIEAIGYLLLLIAALFFFASFVLNSFQGIVYTATLFFAATSVITISSAYLINKAYLYRVPLDTQYLFCFHDSGLTFYSRTLVRSDQEHDEISISYLTGVFMATDVIVKQVLRQQVTEATIQSPQYTIYFKRDPTKKVGVGVIGRQVSYYLKQWITVMLERIPTAKISDPTDPSTMKVTDNEELEEEMNQIVQRVFPYFRVIEQE